MATKFLWTCPFCDRHATIGDSDVSVVVGASIHKSVRGYRKLRGTFIICPNPACREFTLDVVLLDTALKNYEWIDGAVMEAWRLIPPSKAKAFPSYIPDPILADYREASLIVDASPKASATLARRCLQGMIRDFWRISKSRLKDEIDELKDHVDGETWAAIDSIRKVGNIGAHMEKDVNIIVEVESGEAEKLIWLIELLLKEWYVRRHERQEHLAEIAKIGEQKRADKKSPSKA